MPSESGFQYEFKWFKDDFDTNPQTRGRMFVNRSALEESRSIWNPPVPGVFELGRFVGFDFLPSENMGVSSGVPVVLTSLKESACISSPIVGIILAGEWAPASGTHNVIVGIVRRVVGEYGGRVFGFLGGPQGFSRGHYIDLTLENVSKYLNQGGSDLLGYGSLRALSRTDYLEIKALTRQYNLTGLVFVGGPNEVGHVSQIVRYSAADDESDRFPTIVCVFQSPNASVYVPLWIPITLGFDTNRVALCEYSGNIAKDSRVVNLVRCGSTITTIEVALWVCPAYTILGDELLAKNVPIDALIAEICQVIESRLTRLNSQTTILISDKFYESIKGFRQLQSECRYCYQTVPILVVPKDEVVNPELYSLLTPESSHLLKTFSTNDQFRLVRAYDSDGNPTMPETEPEKYLAKLIHSQMKSVNIKTHTIGAEGRCGLPTNFDCSFGLSLGLTAGCLVTNPKCHGYIACVTNLCANSPQMWKCGGIPIEPLLLPSRANDSTLSIQYGGANQELINLARQRIEKESTVPRIFQRENILNDPLFKKLSQQLLSSKSVHQPGPYQFDLPGGQQLPYLLCPTMTPTQSLCQRRLDYQPKSPRIPKMWSDNPGKPADFLIQLVFPFTHVFSAGVVPQWENRRDHVWALDCVMDTHSHVPCVMEIPQEPSVLSIPETPIHVNTLGCVEPMHVNRLPTRVGIVFMGRSSAGCHNVIHGLVSFGVCVVGILNGSRGLINCEYIEIASVGDFLNQSGIDMLGRSETFLKTRADFLACAETCQNLRLDGLVIVGGIGTHADTALLGEVLAATGVATRLVGVPAGIENDIPQIPQTLGHDTACKVYSSIIGSLSTLAASSKRCWCFIRLNGPSSLSHVLAKIAQQTHPNLVLISEELVARKMGLGDIVGIVADLITERAKNGFDFGIVVFGECVLSQIEEIERFREEMRSGHTCKSLSAMSRAIFECLPTRLHAHVSLDPEILLQSLVSRELQRRKMICAQISSGSFVSSVHCLNSNQSSLPSNFDCDLGYTMGLGAASLIVGGKSGVLVNVSNLSAPTNEWKVSGIPIIGLLTIKYDSEASECLIEIKPKQVQLPFSRGLAPPSLRRFVHPGPLQFYGVGANDRLKSLKDTPDEQSVEDVCSQLMALAANAPDETIRRIIQTGLDQAKAIISCTTESALTQRKTRSAQSHETNDFETLRKHGSHCRIVKIVQG